ncbi:MAG: hypothetical protein LBC73_04825 [Oscillospiraceae bacterium]|jgi:hypothetical protein|nr:hypothetical protein [Oscillospiraceae bacterium]
MGTWSSSLYGNDTTQDVRDTYTEYLYEQLSNQEALDKTIEDYQDLIGDEEDEPLFWFALAETQWKVGRLTPQVKEKATEWIEKDGGIILWEDSSAGIAAWKKTLTKLKEKLESPMRSEKKMEKLNQNLWNIGDVYAYQFNTEESKKFGRYGKYVLIQKTGEDIQREHYCWMTEEELAKLPMMMIIYVFNKLFNSIPTLKDIEDIQLLPNIETTNGEIKFNKFMRLVKKSYYPAKNLFYLGNAPISIKNTTPSENYVFWHELENMLNYYFSKYGDEFKA